MKIGKLPNDVLEEIVFENIDKKRKEVLVGAELGEDNAIIDFGEDVCIMSTDPITGASKGLGKLAVNISCNDIASSGGEPVAILLTILLPPSTELEELKEIMIEVREECKQLNLDLVGGHTEVTDAVNRIVLSTTVVGRQKKVKVLDKKKVGEGHRVYISKDIAIEGTSILSRELEDILKEKLSEEEMSIARDMDKKLSVLKEGRLAGELGVDYMHDITEGGLFGALWEASRAVGYGIEIYSNNIPIDPVSKKVADILKIDPYRLISSGSMLMIVDREREASLKEKMAMENIKISLVGEIKGKDIVVVDTEKKYHIEAPESDELYKVLSL